MQSLFPDPIQAITPLDPGYEDHASDVWRVDTTTGRWVVRASRMHGRPDNCTWGAFRILFGIDPRRLEALGQIGWLLGPVSPIAVPTVLRIAPVKGRPHAVVDWLKGGALDSFRGATPQILTDLGDFLGRVHSRTFPYLGAPDGELQIAPADWGEHLAVGMGRILAEFFPGDSELAALLPKMQAVARLLPAPTGGTLVMPDLDASQFLGGPEGLTALVDVESYVLGPMELDLCGLELILGPEEAAPFVAAYTRHRALPDLVACRPLYRFLLRLWEAQGNRPIATYMAYPILY